MSFKEEPVLWILGKVIMALGLGALVFTIFFDKQIAGRTYNIIGWVQLSGVIASCALFLFGAFVDKLMVNDIIPLLKKLLNAPSQEEYDRVVKSLGELMLKDHLNK